MSKKRLPLVGWPSAHTLGSRVVLASLASAHAVMIWLLEPPSDETQLPNPLYKIYGEIYGRPCTLG